MSKVLVLRTCRSDMSSNNGFAWPAVGEVAAAPDFLATNECGFGLHGWLYGQGDYSSSNYLDNTALWLVVEVELESIIMLGGKCKFPKGIVRFIGDKKSATDYLRANEPNSHSVAVIGATIEVGDNQSAIVGALGTATAGRYGTATAGDYGTATAGDYGTATAGRSGTATAGRSGTATAGDYGTATAGENGEIRIRYWDDKSNRYRTKIGYIGECGLKPGVAYRIGKNNLFVKAN